jgi:hypothetical protein
MSTTSYDEYIKLTPEDHLHVVRKDDLDSFIILEKVTFTD